MGGRLQFFLGLVTIVAVLVLAWFVLSTAVSYLTHVDRAVAGAVIAGLVAIFSVLFGYWKERDRSRREAHREKKIEIYNKFFDLVFAFIRDSKDHRDTEELQTYIVDSGFEKEFLDLVRGVVFYGSPQVIIKMSKWKSQATENADPVKSIRDIGDVFLAMREDIGLSNRGLDSLSIHQLYVREDLKTLGLTGATQ